MKSKIVVVALGGNAILTDDPTEHGQRKAVKKTAKALIKFVKDGYKLVITHGNGPQVGNLLLQQLNSNSKDNPAMPLDTVGAMTEGSIGYWLQNALQEELVNNNLSQEVVTIITQMIVDKNDPAFLTSSKPIGPFYSEDQLPKISKAYPDWTLKKDANRGYRRVVPSPKPLKIKEENIIKVMISNNIIPIVSGGGGIPVIKENNQLIGKEAVIDKDFSAAKVAELLQANNLIILTSVNGVYYNFNQPNKKFVKNVKVVELQAKIQENEFAAGSMLPKVQAAIDYVNVTHHQAIIGNLQNVEKIIEGNSGTVIEP